VTDRQRRRDPGRDLDQQRFHHEVSDQSPFTRRMSPSEMEFAADLSAVQADDALLDALGGSDPRVADGLGDQELNALLLAWRRDIDSEPLAELVDTDTAVATVKHAALVRRHGRGGRKRRLLVPVAAAAAVLTIAFTGTGLAARDAQPGDTLWGVTKVLYADHARSIEAAVTARLDLQTANLALVQGRFADARKALDDAQQALAQVSSDDNLAQLMEQHRQLSSQLGEPATPAPAAGQSRTPASTPTPVPPVQIQPSPPVDASATTPPTDTSTVTPPDTSTTTPPTSTTSATPDPNSPGGASGNSPRMGTIAGPVAPTS
jgi:hypothetical protein